MAATVVTSFSVPDANAASLTCASFDSTGGNHIVVFACAENTLTTGTPVADSKSNTYTDVGTEYLSSGKRIRCFYKENATCGTSHTITLTPGASGKLSFATFILAGIATSSSLDANGPIGKADIFQTVIAPTAAFTPSVDGCAVVTGGYFDTGHYVSVSSPFTADTTNDPVAGGQRTNLAHVIQTTAASVQPTWTYDAQSVYIGVMVVAFKAAAGAGDLSRTLSEGTPPSYF